jgi:hypothetical protein
MILSANDSMPGKQKRWDVELCFRDIKTTMGLDTMRFQPHEMIRKKILMYFIAYNCEFQRHSAGHSPLGAPFKSSENQQG